MPTKFNIVDLIHLYEVVHALRTCTVPLNEHTDPLSNEDCWNEVNDLLDKLGASFKEQLVDQESIEKLIGKKIHKFEKRYDANGVFSGVDVYPVEVIQFIDMNFTITPTGTNFENGKEHN
jgi:hypothetical protein